MNPRWLKGNTHTHTDRSDGDAPLEDVPVWYESHGYDFLVITDHNRVTDVPPPDGAAGGLVLLPGCEVTLISEGEHDYEYTTYFIGAGGRALAKVHGSRPAYHSRGDEGYVRAKVYSSNGGVAWTQPVFTSS